MNASDMKTALQNLAKYASILENEELEQNVIHKDIDEVYEVVDKTMSPIIAEFCQKHFARHNTINKTATGYILIQTPKDPETMYMIVADPNQLYKINNEIKRSNVVDKAVNDQLISNRPFVSKRNQRRLNKKENK